MPPSQKGNMMQSGNFYREPWDQERPANLVIRTNGEWEERPPLDGKSYKLDEMKACIGGGWIDRLEVGPAAIPVVFLEASYEQPDQG